MALTATNATEDGLDTAMLDLEKVFVGNEPRVLLQVATERNALARDVGLALGLGLVAGTALGVFAQVARRRKEDA